MLNKSQTSKDLRAMAADCGLTCKNQKNCGEMVFVGKNVSRASFDLFLRGTPPTDPSVAEEELLKKTKAFLVKLLEYLKNKEMVANFEGRNQKGTFINGWRSTHQMPVARVDSTMGLEEVFNNVQFESWENNPSRNVHITFRVQHEIPYILLGDIKR